MSAAPDLEPDADAGDRQAFLEREIAEARNYASLMRTADGLVRDGRRYEPRLAHYAPGRCAWVMVHVDDPAHVAHFDKLFGQPRSPMEPAP